MQYFKNENGKVYAYNDEDVTHDEGVRDEITKLEQEKPAGYAQVIEHLKSKIRVKAGLTQITKEERDALLAPSDDELTLREARKAHEWVARELESVTIELMYHWTEDKRASATEQDWKDYAIALRNYTTTGEGGNPQIVTEKPERP